jgi:hypothetical protein
VDFGQLLSQYGGQGIFFVLFIYLFLKSEKESKEREQKYQELLNKVTDTICKDVCEIKTIVQTKL